MFNHPFRIASRHAARERAQHWSDEVGHAGNRWADNAREFAAQGLERAASRIRDLREGVAETTNAAQRHMGHYAEATRRYVSDQPLRSTLIAAAAGGALAALILSIRNRHEHD